MITSRPIKRNAAIVQFSRDHHFTLLLVWKIKQGLRFNVEPQRIANYINFFFKNNLKKHFKEEEELLFTQLPENDDLRLSAEKDHKLLQELNEKIKSQPEISSLKDFATKLEQHIRFEERLLFNHLQATIEKSALDMIENKLHEHQPQKEDGWTDEFWIQ